MKTCNICRLKKQLTEFKIRVSSKDGRKSWCATCETKYQHKKHLERKACREVRHF